MKTSENIKQEITEKISSINNRDDLHYILTFITTLTENKGDKDHE